MSKNLLVQLLGVQEKGFKQYIEKLERACLRPGIDIRLSAEIITKTREKARALGLSKKDTTPKELYYALKGRLVENDKSLRTVLKLEKATPEKIAKTLASTTQKLSKNELCLSLTTAGTKRILKAVPPRKTMRALSYRSLDSVMKRTDPRLLYAVANLVEDKSWRSQAHAKMRRLDAKDIVWHPVESLAVPKTWHKKLQDIFKDEGMYIVNAETGVVCTLPIVNDEKPGLTTLSLGLLLQAAQRLSIESLPYRQNAFNQGYSVILPELAHGVRPPLVSIHGLMPTWKVVHELIGKGHISAQSPETEFLVGDIGWQSTEMKLASLVPEMDFWVDSHYLAVGKSNKPVSLHLIDVASSVVQDAKYGDHNTHHFEDSLWNELQVRYLQEDVLSHSLVDQLTKRSQSSVDVLI